MSRQDIFKVDLKGLSNLLPHDNLGWLTWLLWKIDSVINGSVWGFELFGMLLFAMGSSAFSYFFDTAIRLMETFADPVILEEDDSEDEDLE